MRPINAPTIIADIQARFEKRARTMSIVKIAAITSPQGQRPKRNRTITGMATQRGSALKLDSKKKPGKKLLRTIESSTPTTLILAQSIILLRCGVSSC